MNKHHKSTVGLRVYLRPDLIQSLTRLGEFSLSTLVNAAIEVALTDTHNTIAFAKSAKDASINCHITS